MSAPHCDYLIVVVVSVLAGCAIGMCIGYAAGSRHPSYSHKKHDLEMPPTTQHGTPQQVQAALTSARPPLRRPPQKPTLLNLLAQKQA